MSLIRRYFITPHFFIAACALALTLGSYAQSKAAMGDFSYPLFVFCGTIIIYTLHRMIAILQAKPSELPPRLQEFTQMQPFPQIVAFIALLTAAGLLLSHWQQWSLWIYPPLFLSGIYVVPLKNGRLVRQIPFIKIFIIAISWTWITTLNPLVLQAESIDSPSFLRVAERFLFIFAITIPFDIRDQFWDAQIELRTFPSSLGRDGSQQLALGILLLAIFLSTYQYFLTEKLSLALSHLLIYILAAIQIRRSHPDRSEMFFAVGIDGLLLLLGLAELASFTFSL